MKGWMDEQWLDECAYAYMIERWMYWSKNSSYKIGVWMDRWINGSKMVNLSEPHDSRFLYLIYSPYSVALNGEPEKQEEITIFRIKSIESVIANIWKAGFYTGDGISPSSLSLTHLDFKAMIDLITRINLTVSEILNFYSMLPSCCLIICHFA